MTTIPHLQDYDDDDPNINFRKKRWNYWESLKKVRVEYMQDAKNGQFDAYDFEDYIEKKYGIKMQIVNGNITDGYKIMDEKKYIVFLLKFQ
jgi:hypothetical protein